MTTRETAPSLREFFAAQLLALRELLLSVMNEKDHRYEDRFRAQEEAVRSALAAQKELTNAAFAASEKAITKAEAAQTSYNERTNELRGTLDDWSKQQLPRKEADARFIGQDQKLDELKAEVASLRESRSAAGGRDRLQQDTTAHAWTLRALLVTSILSVLGALVAVGVAIYDHK